MKTTIIKVPTLALNTIKGFCLGIFIGDVIGYLICRIFLGLMFISLLALAASAQTVTTMANLSQEPSIRFRTNGVFTVDHVADGKTNKITYQEIVTEQAPVQVIKILVGDYTPIATNRISLAQSFATKPLLSAQRPLPKVATPPAKAPVAKPSAKIPGPPPKRDASTNVVTIHEITNTPAWKRAHHVPPYK